MSNGFRDSFTKDDSKEDILGYDDTAFYYFVISVLTCVALPWTLSVIRSLILPSPEVEKEYPTKTSEGSIYRYPQTAAMVHKVSEGRIQVKRFTTRDAIMCLLKTIALSAIWAGIFGTGMQLGHEKEINKFDPFELLDVTPQATSSQIKRNYRKLSLVYHPDKNADDPLAASRFIQITKAYQALTDDVARRNWEKFGNPDGPQISKVGIGLPRFLLEKDNHLMILFAFFFILIFLVPVTFICYYQNTKNYAANGVLIDTLQFLGYYINDSTRVKSGPELLAASCESRQMTTKPSDNAHMKKLAGHVIEHKKRVFTVPVVMKNQYLVWAHLQRRHDLMSEELRKDLDELLGYGMKVTQAMIEIACMREWFATAQSMIDFRRCLVQALDVKSSQLLQIPHFKEEHVERCRVAASPVTTLAEFLSLDAENRKKIAEMTPEEMLDVEAFCAHVGDRVVKASIAVEDESEIVVGDVATVTVQMFWKHLQKGQAQGPANSPLFPELKFEEWWLFLVEPGAGSTRIVHFEVCRDNERMMEEKLRFQVTKAGENKLVLHAMCDAYAGLDQKIELTYRAYAEDELQRSFPAHAEDEELDLQPTLFQQWMGDLRQDESEEEEEEGVPNQKAQGKAEGNTPSSPAKGGSPENNKVGYRARRRMQSKDDDDDESGGSSSGSDD
mmetsp:Transcript_78535/g.138373  ORF Transcript_78535/g.138373 Transcript_78535/m.138373 type:complete len:671 (-) Transcript_78535:132-2144(-)|eukprot:CAMPEP_0197638218 /NCGR_PEP_ID=MMETSP1338-20131121/13210_1 /TAXON_ID=43686 ORGANISM="Pelagodinium beii, Strain RCC1491" /NCGR_SAMPLE_ID=MMETSP1338 /ASSEMBLY_ACC=CAM_ASM_000754 /LENGTH=670 /DNA_ID=CAMNT_0043210763 /DNA_START=31 /DNA_END=2043 /DNA_ORIENTATION=+